MRTAGENLEVWFLTGSQELYGEATLRQVAAQSKEIVALLNGGPEIGAPLVWKPVLTDARTHPPRLPGRQQRRPVHRCGGLDAHLFPGQSLDRRARRPA